MVKKRVVNRKMVIEQEGNTHFKMKIVVTITKPPPVQGVYSSYQHVIECWFPISLSNYTFSLFNFTANFFSCAFWSLLFFLLLVVYLHCVSALWSSLMLWYRAYWSFLSLPPPLSLFLSLSLSRLQNVSCLMSSIKH